MTKLNVNIGLSVNDKTGDTLRSAFDKINQNFTELYSRTGDDVQIPSVSGQSSRFLTTDGNVVGWGTVSKLGEGSTSVSLEGDQVTFPNAVKFRSGSNLSLSIGYSYGNITQGTNSVAFGAGAGVYSQGDYATALGGQTAGNQSYGATAVGCFAGGNYQGISAVAIGLNAGSGGAVAGTYTPTGSTGTTLKFVLIGLLPPVVGMAVRGTGFSTQTVVSVDSATQVTLSAPPDSTPSSNPAGIQFHWVQGDFSIAIGHTAGSSSSITTPSIASKTIILNASNVALSGVPYQTDSFYVNPIRSAAATSNVLYYNTTTKEVTYGTPIVPNGSKASNASGTAGQTSYDSNYFYVCIATDTWRRVALGGTY
jgi:hypothetical protein